MEETTKFLEYTEETVTGNIIKPNIKKSIKKNKDLTNKDNLDDLINAINEPTKNQVTTSKKGKKNKKTDDLDDLINAINEPIKPKISTKKTENLIDSQKTNENKHITTSINDLKQNNSIQNVENNSSQLPEISKSKKKKQNKEKKQPPISKSRTAFINKLKAKVDTRKEEEEKLKQQQEMIKKAQEEAEKKALELEKLELEKREAKKLAKKEYIKKLKEQGKPITKAQKIKQARFNMLINNSKQEISNIPIIPKKINLIKNNIISPIIPDPIIEIESSVPDDWMDELELIENKPKLIDPIINNEINLPKKTLRSPVICVLGHVDTGKTKILDKLRLTNVQENEAGGITQQIGVTNVIKTDIMNKISYLDYIKDNFQMKLPGLLLIDTPGHESFRNLRSRGSSLCDFAILVVDIMHGMEQQTLESFKLLIEKKAPFVIALNKVDRIYNWKSDNSKSIFELIKIQDNMTFLEFTERLNIVISKFAEQGVNASLATSIPIDKQFIPIIPTSAYSGDGISDLIAYICQYSQKFLLKKLTTKLTLEAIIMEVKSIIGFGNVIDVILINGILKEGDTIVITSSEGAIVSQIKSILTSASMTDLRSFKGNYIKHKQVTGSIGIRLSLSGEIDKIIAGTPIYLVENNNDIDLIKNQAELNIKQLLESFHLEDKGVYVQSSTLGSLEALLEFLKTSKIPYSGINIGPIHKKDVMRASTMHQHDSNYAVILAFDIKVDTEVANFAKKENVKIFTANIIYHLFDSFKLYTEECLQIKKEQNKLKAIFPCKLSILPQFIFNKRDPIIIGLNVIAGTLKIGTPICVPSKNFINLGIVSSIENNHKSVQFATIGQEVSVKIDNINGETPKMYERHFFAQDELVSKISRESIDILKDYFRDEVNKNDWKLIIELKKTFNII